MTVEPYGDKALHGDGWLAGVEIREEVRHDGLISLICEENWVLKPQALVAYQGLSLTWAQVYVIALASDQVAPGV